MNKRTFSAYVSFALKVVGIIIIVSSLLDYFILAIPFQPLNSDWQIALTRQMVDRGIVPMVGIAFLISGYWLQEQGTGKIQPVSFGDLRLWTCIFASIMGLIFFLLVPLHLSNLSLVRGRAMAQIEQRFETEEQRIQNRTDQIRQVLEDPANVRLQLEDWRSRAINPSSIEQIEQILTQFEEVQKNPELLDEQSERAITELRDRRQQAESRARTNVFKSGFRIGVNSLLLAIGYIIIGWTGLRDLPGGGALPLSRHVRAR
ncbi:MAG: HpsJ family protein [Spirulina sp.]